MPNSQHQQNTRDTSHQRPQTRTPGGHGLRHSEQPVIAAEQVSYRYAPSPGGTAALVDISLSIDRGELVAILGNNGSGKSTLARLGNALLTPTDGRMYIEQLDSRDRSQTREVRRTVGMVFPNPDHQFVGSTVEEDVAFGPENLGLPRALIAMRVREALHEVGMVDAAARAPRQLSGGEKQRVALAGILAMKPTCLILDEATAMLDPGGRSAMLELIRRLNRESGLTVLHITHDMEEAVLADRIIVLEAGRVVLDGPPVAICADADRLETLGLALPQGAMLCRQLREDGFPLPDGILRMDQAATALLRLVSGKDPDVSEH